MKLSIKDRLYLPLFLPERGNFKQFNLKKEILRRIVISEGERTEINLHENEDSKRIEWDVAKELPLHTEFSKEELEYLQSACEKISDQDFPDDMWGTVERIYDALQEV